MAVPAGPTEKIYTGNGVTTLFPVPFLIIQPADLAVYVNGVRLTSGYTQAGVGNPISSVTFTVAPALSAVIMFQLDVPFERLNDYQENGDFLAPTVNRDFDRIWQALKQLLRYSGRALTLDQFDVDGQGWYRAKGNGIRDLRDPVELQDAATKRSVQQMIADALGTGAGPGNNAANITYVTPGALITTVQAKLRETVSLSDFNSLREALIYGELVHVPASTGSITVSAADSPFVLPNLWRVSAEGELNINLGPGVHATASGVICRVGARNSTIKLLGPAPTETKATAVTAVTGTPGDWQVTYALNSSAGIQVGDFAKLFDVGPLPILMGDNAASYILRDYPLMGEIYQPLAQNVGAITYNNGGGSVSFASVNGALTQFIKPNDLIHSKGQTRRVNTVGALSASIFGAWTNGGLTASPSFFTSRPNTGTIGTGGVASQTITGTGTQFTSEANVGSILLAEGTMLRIISIASDGSMAVDAPISLANGTYYSILHPLSALHAGVHEVTNVAGNSVTVRNYSQQRPPINGITVDEFKIIKTVLKQNGVANGDDGFVFDQNGAVREINNLVIVGPSAGANVGLLLQNRIPSELAQGTTSFGDVTQHGLRGNVLFGENTGVTRFYRGLMTGHGCLLNARKLAVTNNIEVGVWTLESGMSNLRRAQISGGSIGLAVNSGGNVVITETMLIGCGNDGIRADANASLYGECPIAVGCVGMNFRFVDSGGCHLTDGVSLLSNLSGVYCDGADVRFDRMIVGANGRAGIELVNGSEFHFDSGWASGTSNTAGPGYGLQIGDNCTYLGSNSAFVGNEAADVAIPTGAVNAQAILRSSHYLLPVSGVSRLNSPNQNGSSIWDGAGVDTGASTPTVGAASGTLGAVTGAALAWSRDKDRYEFDARVTITTVGTAGGYLTMSLPFTATQTASVSAINQTTGAACAAYVTGSELRIYSAAGAFPAANGNTILIAGALRA